MASPLYDKSKMDEPKKPTMRDRKDEAVGAGEADQKKKDMAAEAGEDKGLSMAMDGADKLIEGLKSLHKAHESERRDFHGNTREAMRQMAMRHEKQLRDLHESHMAGLGAGTQMADQMAEGAADQTAAAGAAEEGA